MAQQNSYRRKQRSVVKTILIFGEGLDDKMFLNHLKLLYCSRNTGVSVTVKKGKGGDPASIVVDAAKEAGDYHRRVVLLDNDKSDDEMKKGREEAHARDIELIEVTPCLEGFLLAILGDIKTFPNSHSYKHEFGKKHIPEDKRDDPKEYEQVFLKELFERKRADVIILDSLIKIFEGH